MRIEDETQQNQGWGQIRVPAAKKGTMGLAVKRCQFSVVAIGAQGGGIKLTNRGRELLGKERHDC